MVSIPAWLSNGPTTGVSSITSAEMPFQGCVWPRLHPEEGCVAKAFETSRAVGSTAKSGLVGASEEGCAGCGRVLGAGATRTGLSRPWGVSVRLSDAPRLQAERCLPWSSASGALSLRFAGVETSGDEFGRLSRESKCVTLLCTPPDCEMSF